MNCPISSSKLLKLPNLFSFWMHTTVGGGGSTKLAELGTLTLTLNEFSVSSRAMRLIEEVVVHPFQVSLLVPSSFMLV